MSISQLINDLNSDQLAVRRRAAEQLAAAPDAAAAVSLVRACGDADEQVREWAVAALEQLGPPDAADGPAILNLLTNANRDVRYWSATLLGRLGRLGASAVGPLGEAVENDPDSAVRQRAAWRWAKWVPRRVGSASPGTGGPGRRSPLGAVGPAIAGKDPGRLILAGSDWLPNARFLEFLPQSESWENLLQSEKCGIFPARKTTASCSTMLFHKAPRDSIPAVPRLFSCWGR